MVKTTPQIQALKDIYEYYRENGIESFDQHTKETWYIHKRHLVTKETTILNKELGLSGINMNKTNMNRH